MHDYLPGLSALKAPPMYRVRQRFDEQHLGDVAAALSEQLTRDEIVSRLRPGMTVALAVGSRGIADIPLIVRTTCDFLKNQGVNVFIVPCMGSHGGATAEGQKTVLGHLGVTEESAGVPIRSGMEVVEVGSVESKLGNDVALYMDAIAHREADLVIPIVRIKSHTGFKGKVESGICKMLTIGLGKHVGCSRLHREGMAVFDHLIPTAGEAVLAMGRIAFVVAMVENAYEQTAMIEASLPECAIQREGELLVEAKRLISRFLMPRVDVLIIEEVGKNISGAAMDANVTGRGELGGALADFKGPQIIRIVVLGLTKITSGNAHGIGHADIITERVFEQIDRQMTWTNTLTAGSLGCGRLPIALPTEEQAIMAAASCVPGVDAANAKIVRIKDTLSLTEIAVSENMIHTIKQTEGCELIGPWDGRWQFDPED